MVRRFNAHFANGVLVPEGRVELPEFKRLSVTVEEDEAQPAKSTPRYDDPNDPMPAGGVALIDWWARHRIQIDPKIAQHLAESDEYLDQDSADES